MSLSFRAIRSRIAAAALAAGAGILVLPLLATPDEPRGSDRYAYALTGARVLVSPGRAIDPGVVVIRGEVIEAVGPADRTTVPADARVFDVKGKIVHAAFLDPYVTSDRLAGKKPRGPQDEE